MAPRTRTNRIEGLAKPRILASGGVFNAQGFPALPVEIYLEIISYFPVMPVPTHEVEQGDTDGLRARHLTLFSLSQTCRSLRRVFLGYLWQRIEVFDGMQTPKGCLLSTQERIRAGYHSIQHKLYAEELIRQLEIVTFCDPNLAQCVNIVNVVITSYSAKSVLKEVAKAFSLFPNLHTVQLNLATRGWRMANTVFGDHRYPHIRSLSLNSTAFFFPKFCPEVRSIVPYLGQPFCHWIRDCPNLEVLGTTILHRVIPQDSIVINMKNLRDITLVPNSLVCFEDFKMLSLLPHLHTIRLRMDKENSFLGPSYPVLPEQEKPEQCEVDEVIQYARKVLSEEKGDKSVERRIIVTYEDGQIVTLNVFQ